ncbi:MAG TPA: prepilin-type N-terminal cleavage/methylation domain-containing protein [Candidatus Omnitrophota bacterium]|nr:prepilin-type N-terminal cleavage/methylation domain-containing protein [Candidatus Omnitrophota bacterium]
MGRRGFTLVEVLISLAVFTILVTVSSGWMIKMAGDWKKQRDYIAVTEEADWVLSFISQEIKQSYSSAYMINATDHSLFLQTGPGQYVVYRRSGNVLVRKSGTTPVESSWTDVQNLSKTVVNDDIFLPSTDPACVNMTFFNLTAVKPGLCINLVFRPYPSQPATVSGNKEYTLKTLVNFKN